MTAALTLWMSLFSVLVPQKMWFAPTQPISIMNKSDKDVTFELETFFGLYVPPTGSADLAAHQTADLRKLYQSLSRPGIYILYALPKGTEPTKTGAPKDFLGTPMVIECLMDQTSQREVQVVRVVPLQFAVMNTDSGSINCIFFYDAAPHTVQSFLDLASEGYFDGLTFHRIVPGFVIQGGDPTASGNGGPGYHLDAEFSPRPHLPGVLSMARLGDPAEDPQQGTMPRPQFANSAGSQFFICLDAENCRTLNGRYTAFGQVSQGMDVVKKIADAKLADPRAGRPEAPQTINSVEVRGVTSADNPYGIYMTLPTAPAAPAPPPAK